MVPSLFYFHSSKDQLSYLEQTQDNLELTDQIKKKGEKKSLPRFPIQPSIYPPNQPTAHHSNQIQNIL